MISYCVLNSKIYLSILLLIFQYLQVQLKSC